KLLEEWALIPGGALELLEGLAQVLLGDVHDANLQRLVRLRVVHQIMEPAPGPFQRAEFFVVDDGVDLLRQLLVDLGDDRLDRLDRVVAHHRRRRQSLLRQRLHALLDGFGRAIGLGLECPRHQFIELGGLDLTSCSLCCFCCFCHVTSSPRRRLDLLGQALRRAPGATSCPSTHLTTDPRPCSCRPCRTADWPTGSAPSAACSAARSWAPPPPARNGPCFRT